MTMSYTRTYSWTRTNARELASKVAADLAYFRIFHGKPSEADAGNYEAELTEYLASGYLDYVIYGYRRDGNWVAALRYQARMDGTLADEGAGRLMSIIGSDTTNAVFHSFLVQNSAWSALTEVERQRFRDTLPFQRTTGTEPGTGFDYWDTDRSYSSGGGGVSRSVLKSYG